MYTREFEVRPVITRTDNPNISMSAVTLKGLNRRTMNMTHAVYICVDGEVTFGLGQDNNISFITLTKGKSLSILPGTPYFDFSKNGVTMIAINREAFNAETVQELPIPKRFNYMLSGISTISDPYK